MIGHTGSSVFSKQPKQAIRPNAGNGGGNSGCIISPSPDFGGLSAYQDPKVPVNKNLPKRQGGS
jgi:hypothetical protein